MANSDLEGNFFKISTKQIDFLKKNISKLTTHLSNNSRGINIIKNIIKTGGVSYENTKRIINLYETSDDIVKQTLGGKKFYNFLKRLLDRKRNIIYKRKLNKKNRGEKNAFLKPHLKEQKIFIVSENYIKHKNYE